MLISIVIPCYYSEKNLPHVVELTIQEFAAHPGYEPEFILVNDGSTDGTYAVICGLAEKYPFVTGVDLLRNFGQHNALMAALHYVHGDYVLGMDDDMQTHPSQIFRLVDKIREGYDLVYGRYPHRVNSAAKNLSSRFNEISSRILLGRPKEITSSNFWIITRLVAEQVRLYDSYNPYIDGVFYRVTHNIANVDVEHHKRESGSSGYTLKKLMRLWMAYWNYSVIPLRISAVIGSCAAAGGFLALVFIVIKKLCDPTTPMGWSSVIGLILFFSGLILLCLGIIGEYIGKLILTINHTPQFIVRRAVGEHRGDLPVSREAVLSDPGDPASPAS